MRRFTDAASLKWIFVCEIQTLSLLVLAIYPYLALTKARPLLLGTFEIESFGQGFCVALLFSLVGVSIVWTAELFFVAAAARLREELPKPGAILTILGGAVLGLSILLNLILVHNVSSETNNTRLTITNADSGMILGLTCGIILLMLGELIRRLDLASRMVNSLNDLLRSTLKRMYRRPISGYTHLEGAAPIEAGHLTAVLLLIVSVLFFLGLRESKLPSLGSLLLLMIPLIWFLSGASFFLQRYRIPIILPLMLWFVVAGRAQTADHYYRVSTYNQNDAEDATSTPMAAKFGSMDSINSDSRILVVAAAGGGIQAAAWTAEVLTRLESYCDEGHSGKFASSLAAVSGISGGSTGLMYYLGSKLARSERAESVRKAAQSSSLEEVAHVLATDDLAKAFIPWFYGKAGGRGQALEDAWLANTAFDVNLNSVLERATLRGWTMLTKEHQLPAIIFNSTMVEKGQRFTFSTSQIDDHQVGQGNQKMGSSGEAADGTEDFATLYPEFDVAIKTAVRMSATFPYVSPASRPLLQVDGEKGKSKDVSLEAGKMNLHLVDGGLFDGSGIMGLCRLLHSRCSGLSPSSAFHPKILVLLVSSFPELKGKAIEAQQGTFFQTLAPLSTLLNVMGGGHEGSARKELALLRESVASKIDLGWIDFRFTYGAASSDNQSMKQVAEEVPPLSWHLTKKQRVSITCAWPGMLEKASAVKKFLETGQLPDSSPANSPFPSGTVGQ